MSERYAVEFQKSVHHLPGANWPELHALRMTAFETWNTLGFPSKKVEDWKYSSTLPLSNLEFSETAQKTSLKINEKYLVKNAITLIMQNGQWQNLAEISKSLPKGVRCLSLSQACLEKLPTLLPIMMDSLNNKNSDGFDALNTALMQEGLVLFVESGVELPPLQIMYHHGDHSLLQLRNIIILSENAKATLIETFVGDAESATFTNVITDVTLAKAASLTHAKIIEEDNAAYHVGRLRVDAARDATLTSHSAVLAGKWVRSDTQVALNAENASAYLYGIYALNGQQHCDHHTAIFHNAAHCTSREHYRGIIDDKATAVFNGKVWVAPFAVKSDADQLNKNLLLSREATVNTKPQLEIFNDDVKCTHGATVGQLDKDALFYLQSRGIDKDSAEVLLRDAFAISVIECMSIPGLPELLRAALNEKAGGSDE